MRKTVVIHGEPTSTSHAPTSIHGPMKLLEKAVKGTYVSLLPFCCSLGLFLLATRF